MTAPETFITRWVRLKRNADPRRATKDVTDTPTIPTPDLSAGTTEAAISQPRSEAATSDELFDPAGLPSIEAITANTDIRGFLQSRVPADLTRAARSWWRSRSKLDALRCRMAAAAAAQIAGGSAVVKMKPGA